MVAERDPTNIRYTSISDEATYNHDEMDIDDEEFLQLLDEVEAIIDELYPSSDDEEGEDSNSDRTGQ